MPREFSKALPLDYLQPSPVRGQLEPYDPRANKGWPGRFLQCTDTPNQLKILLPPATATMYEQLLKAEVSELAKNSPISWERILEIRHLKDRMIRKCQKLCKTSSLRRLGRGESFAFQTFVAPSDFRLKEMEKWFRQQQPRPRKDVPQRHSMESISRRNSSSCCSRCEKTHRSGVHGSSSSNSSPSSDHSSLSRPSPPVPASLGEENSVDSKPVHQKPQPRTPSPTNVAIPTADPPPPPVKLQSPPTTPPPPRPSPSSPPPLPHLLRTHQIVPRITVSRHPDSPYDAANVDDSTEQGEVSTPPVEEDTTPQATLHRRPSCIKRSSISDSKTVSWADDRDWIDQMAKYATAAREAQTSGHTLEDIRAIYLEQVAGLDALHQSVAQTLHRFRSETEHLEKIEQAIYDQQEKLRATCEEFERKQSQFQARVIEVLDEADHTVSLCGAKRDAHIQAS